MCVLAHNPAFAACDPPPPPHTPSCSPSFVVRRNDITRCHQHHHASLEYKEEREGWRHRGMMESCPARAQYWRWILCSFAFGHHLYTSLVRATQTTNTERKHCIFCRVSYLLSVTVFDWRVQTSRNQTKAI